MRGASIISLCLLLLGSLVSGCAPFGNASQASEATRPPTATSAPSATPPNTPTPAPASVTPTPTPPGPAPTATPTVAPEPEPEPTMPSIWDRAKKILGMAPVKPANVNLFMTDYLEQPVYPEAYPKAEPMEPATGVERASEEIRAELEAFVTKALGEDDPRAGETLALFDDPRVIERVPDAQLRAAFALLNITIAAPLIDEYLDSGIHAGTLDWRETGWAFTEAAVTGEDGKRYTSMSERYRYEHFAHAAPSIVHALLHHDDRFSYPEDVIVLAVASVTYMQFLVIEPELAHHGTELSRFNNTFAMALLNSHHPGSADITLVVRGGTSVLPGSPVDAPDFWSLIARDQGSSPMSPGARATLENMLMPGTPIPSDLAFGQAAVDLIDGNIDSSVLGPVERLRVSVLLTMITSAEIAVLLDMPEDEVIDLYGLQEVEAVLAARR